jgi:hypothetical protein
MLLSVFIFCFHGNKVRFETHVVSCGCGHVLFSCFVEQGF